MLGQPIYQIKTIFIREAVDVQEDVMVTLYVPKRIVKDSLSVGDDLNCYLRLYAKVKA